MPAQDVGFAGSAWMRLAAAGLFAVIAIGGVRLVDHAGAGSPSVAAPTAAIPPVAGHLVLESTYPVAHWTVQVLGREVGGAVVAPQRWEADTAGNGATIFVQAEAADPGSTAPVALRWTFSGGSGMLWGEGSVAGTLAPPVQRAGAH